MSFGAMLNVAQSDDRLVGTYIRAGDSGILRIEHQDSNVTTFSIDSVGGNCHTCALTGSMTGNVGETDRVADSTTESVCRLSFFQQGDSVTLSPITEDACRDYCGARASFAGRYKKLRQGCFAEARRLRYALANRQYKAKRFQKSEATLNALLAECREFMYYTEVDRVKNDIALSQLHQGRPDNCLKTLASTVAAKFNGDDELREGMSPCDFDQYHAIARSTWFNKAVCQTSRVK